MSRQMMDWAVEQLPKTSIEKVTLMLLADHHNSRTGRCNPSLAGLAVRARCSERSLIRAVDGLEKQGLITVERRRGGRSKYVFHVDQSGDTQSPVHEVNRCQTVTPPLTESHHTSDTVSPESGINQERTRKRERERSPGPHFAPFDFEPDQVFHEEHRHKNPTADYDLELRKFREYPFDKKITNWQTHWIRWWLRAFPDPVAAAIKTAEDWASGSPDVR